MLWIEHPARRGSIDELQARLHPADAAELQAAGLELRAALCGADLYALREHTGQLICLFGCAPHPQCGGIPWMLCTAAVDQVPRVVMADVSRKVVQSWRQQHAHLTNIVHRRHPRAVRFIEWLGFTVDRTPCGPGQEFYSFHWSHPPCATPSA